MALITDEEFLECEPLLNQHSSAINFLVCVIFIQFSAEATTILSTFP
jgi:hypothetical protein